MQILAGSRDFANEREYHDRDFGMYFRKGIAPNHRQSNDMLQCFWRQKSNDKIRNLDWPSIDVRRRTALKQRTYVERGPAMTDYYSIF